jgi:hypothetical protein
MGLHFWRFMTPFAAVNLLPLALVSLRGLWRLAHPLWRNPSAARLPMQFLRGASPANVRLSAFFSIYFLFRATFRNYGNKALPRSVSGGFNNTSRACYYFQSLPLLLELAAAYRACRCISLNPSRSLA